MPLNIKNAAVERLATEVAQMAGETKTEAIRKALEERRERLSLQGKSDRIEHLTRFLEREVWPHISKENLGKRITREEEDEILGYGPDGI